MSECETFSSTNKNDHDDDEWWMSWKKAHLQACSARNTLVASPQQVLDFTTQFKTEMKKKIPDLNFIYWETPERTKIVPWSNSSDQSEREQLVEKIVSLCDNNDGAFSSPATSSNHLEEDQGHAPTPTATTSGGFLSSVTQTVFRPLTYLLSPSKPQPLQPPPPLFESEEPDDLLQAYGSTYQEEELDDFSSQSTKCDNTAKHEEDVNRAPMNGPILNTTLTVACLQLLEQAVVAHHEQDSGIFPYVIARRRPVSMEKLDAAMSWNDWIKSNIQDRDYPTTSQDNNTIDHWKLLQRLSNEEMDFLLDCLAKRKVLSVIPPSEDGVPKQELIILAPPVDLPENENKSTSVENFRRVLASLWEITTVQASLEARRKDWSTASDKWLQQALVERKKRHHLRAGLASLKLHKLFAKQLEQSETTLLNLEQTRHAIEESWHQQQVTKVLKSSTHTLQQLRLNAPAFEHLDQVDQLMEEHREELEHLNTVQGVLAENTAQYDEDDLLQELANLTLEEDDNMESGTNAADSGGTNMKEATSAGASTSASTRTPLKSVPVSSYLPPLPNSSAKAISKHQNAQEANSASQKTALPS